MLSGLREKRQTTMIKFAQEQDGRWFANFPKLPGAIAYGNTKDDALYNLRTILWNEYADLKARRISPKRLETVRDGLDWIISWRVDHPTET